MALADNDDDSRGGDGDDGGNDGGNDSQLREWTR